MLDQEFLRIFRNLEMKLQEINRLVQEGFEMLQEDIIAIDKVIETRRKELAEWQRDFDRKKSEMKMLIESLERRVETETKND